MKCLILKVFVVVILLLNWCSYPQCMLINNNIINDNQQVKIVDNIYNEKKDYFQIQLSIPTLSNLDNKSKEKEINEKILSNAQKRVSNLKSISEKYYKELPAPLFPFQLISKYSITNNEGIISFYIDYYQFTGGAHGITERISYNINEERSEEIQLHDLFEQDYDYKSIINEEIKRQITNNPEGFFMGKDGFSGIKNKQNFYIRDNKIVIYFDLYEIAPYAMGIPEFTMENSLFENK